MFLLAILWHEYAHVFIARAVGGHGYIQWDKNSKKNVYFWRPSAIISYDKTFFNSVVVRLFPIPMVLPFNFLLFLSLSVPLTPRLLSVVEWGFYSMFFGLLLTVIESYNDINETLEIFRGRKTCQL